MCQLSMGNLLTSLKNIEERERKKAEVQRKEARKKEREKKKLLKLEGQKQKLTKTSMSLSHGLRRE